jgi:hypothetical protein
LGEPTTQSHQPTSTHNFGTRQRAILQNFLRSFSSRHKFSLFLPVREIHRALHFILTFFTFRAEARPISVARQTGWRRSLRFGSRHLRQSSILRPLVAQIHISSVIKSSSRAVLMMIATYAPPELALFNMIGFVSGYSCPWRREE